ncbi:MAG: two-component regulator propeller domain-containing protein [Bacteroidales bacterium]
MKKLLLYILSISIFTFNTYASQKEFKFQYISVENGLPSNCIRSIIQDRKGFMWIGTDRGLASYDGINIKLYNTTKDAQGLLHNDIETIYQDKNENLWLGTDYGIFIFDYKTSISTHFDVQTEDSISINTYTTNITSDKDGNLWISTLTQGIFHYNIHNSKLTRYNINELESIITVYIDNENNVWAIVNKSESLYKLDKKNNKFKHLVLSDYNKSTKNSYLCILEDTPNSFYLGSWDMGLKRINPYTGEVDLYPLIKDGKIVKHIHSIIKYDENNLLIGSDDGLVLFNKITNKYKFFACNEKYETSLSDRFIYPITKDNEGGIWIGTYYGGVNYISPYGNQFESYFQSQSHNSINGKIINRFCEDQGNIWIASDDGGLNLFFPQNQYFQSYMPLQNKNSLSFYNVHALCIDNNNLWVGTYTGGINILNLKSKEFKLFNNTPNIESVYSIYKDKENNNIWIGTMSDIILYNSTDKSFKIVKTCNYLIMDIDQDDYGNLWFSTQGDGIYNI